MGSRLASPLLVASALVFMLATLAVPARADDNLETCLDGSYPSLCDKSRLTSEQRIRADAAERRANLETCLDGNYPSLCKHRLLTQEEAVRVRAAERRENLRTCMTGQYKSLCDHSVLTADEAAQVEAAERAENRRTCLAGLYPSLCDWRLLSEEDRQRTAAAEKTQQERVERVERVEPVPRKTQLRVMSVRTASGCIESTIMKPAPFLGNSGEVIVMLDGSVWEVGVGEYNYLYEYYANVLICRGQLVIGEQKIWVTQLK